MKNFNFSLLSLLLLVAAVTNVVAQPAFTSNDFPAAGAKDSTVSPTYYISPSMDTQTGNNYSWNFSNLFPMGSIRYHQFGAHNSSDVPVSPTIPEANLQEINSAADEKWVYEKNTDTLFLHWKYTSSSGTTYAPKLPVLSFPLSLNDSAEVQRPLFVGPSEVASIRYKWRYDGFGTLQLPWATHSNVYRIKTYQRDSAYASGTITEITTYTWYKQGGAFPLLKMTVVAFNGNPVLPAGWYAPVANTSYRSTGGPTGIVAAQELLGVVYPNPANDRLYLHGLSGEEDSYSILDQTGKQVLSGVIPANQQIDISELQSGLYFISKGSSSPVRFTVVR